MQILGQAKDPAVIQAHLKKLFAGVHEVGLTDGKDQVVAALSIEAEKVQLSKPVTVNEQVETWLQSLLVGLQATLQASCNSLRLLSGDDDNPECIAVWMWRVSPCAVYCVA